MPEEIPWDIAQRHASAQECWEAVWARSRAGQHTIIVGAHILPPAPPDLQVLCVQCDACSSSGGALDVARRMIADRLGEELDVPEPRRAASEHGLRQRFLGDFPAPSLDAVFVEACNRLATQSAGCAVLAFEAIDAADTGTVETMAHILQRPGWLRLPVLFTMGGLPQGRVAELVYLLHRADGTSAVLAIAGEAQPAAVAAPGDWAMLPADVLRVLRASAVLGTTFEAELVARLLEEPVSLVLEKLQQATDAGVPITDRGAGQMIWPAATVAALQQRTLPSLLTFWHARLGELLSSGQPLEPGGRSRGAPSTLAQRQRGAPAEGPGAQLPYAPETDRAPLSAFPRHSVPSTPASPAEMTRPAVADMRAQTMGPRPRAGETVPPLPLGVDPTRAATHLQAAGRTEAAVEHYLVAVREAAARGEVQRAYNLTEQALTLLDQLPISAPHALLRTQFLLERGRLQWHGALLGSAFTLQEAQASLDAAQVSLPDDAPQEVVEQLAAVTAGVCYDLGDQESLQRALATLHESSHRLVQAGAVLPAARLLNDQAAIYMRLGDLVRATYLLSQAHERFEHHLRQYPQDAMAGEELAGTKHLLARLPLHVQVPPGHEEESYIRGLEHARAAESIYQRLGQQRPLTYVWETMGRLALQRGELEMAQERLTAAFNLQRQLGDVTGLARSTAALSDLCLRAGQLDQAVALLANSITLNAEKGSPIGLAFNRHTLGALTQAAAQLHSPDTERLRGAVADLEHRLAQAESVLGRVALPGVAGYAALPV
jgi:tetratricopeptide (TPR) repeat protein